MEATSNTQSYAEFISHQNNQIRILRAELKNIREKQKELEMALKRSVSEIKNEVTVVKNSLSTNSEEHTDIVSSYEGLHSFKPISIIKSCYNNKNGTPRQANICSASRASLELDKTLFSNPEHSIAGLEEYSHIWLIFVFHKNAGKMSHRSKQRAKVRAPRMNGETIGVFASRSPHRPCPIGLSLVKLDKIEGSTLHLSAVDLIDGTPILDIKPFIPGYDNPLGNSTSSIMDFHSVNPATRDCLVGNDESETPISQLNNTVAVNTASWIDAPKTSVLRVSFTERAERQLNSFHNKNTHEEKCEHCLDFLNVSEVKNAIENILREDPRSTYRRKKCTDRLYYFSLDSIHVTCWFDDCEPVVEVLRLKPETK